MVFVLKAATSGPHLTIHERNAIARVDLPHYTVPRALHSSSKTIFFVFTYLWQGDVAKKP